jgi:hypothetical protein
LGLKLSVSDFIGFGHGGGGGGIKSSPPGPPIISSGGMTLDYKTAIFADQTIHLITNNTLPITCVLEINGVTIRESDRIVMWRCGDNLYRIWYGNRLSVYHQTKTDKIIADISERFPIFQHIIGDINPLRISFSHDDELLFQLYFD